jgi:glycerol-3-phosphate O-acyltransferase
MTTSLWILGAILFATVATITVVRLRGTRMALRALHRSRSRIDRFKLTKKPFIRQTLLADEAIAQAVREHAAENDIDEGKAWDRVEEYIDEIVPFFNILT